ADEAKLLVNISGHLSWDKLMSRIASKAYIDIDPGFTQFWHADPDSKFKLGGHDAYYTIGRNIGSSRCTIPTGGIDWRHVDQPVVLSPSPLVGEGWGGGRELQRQSASDSRSTPTFTPPPNPLPQGEGEKIRFTTVAAWRGSFGPVYFGGQNFGLK